MSLLDIKFTEPKLKDFKCFRLPIDNLPKYKEVLIFGNVYNFFGTFIDDDFGFTQTSFSGESSADNFMNFGQFVLNSGRATIIASKETCNYYRRLYKEFYKAGFGTTHPNVTFFEIDDIKFLTGKFKVNEGKEEKIVKGEYFWSQNKKEELEFNYLDLLKTIFKEGEKRNMTVIMNPPFENHIKIIEHLLDTTDGIIVNLSPIRWLEDPSFIQKSKEKRYKSQLKIANSLESLEIISKEDAMKLFWAGITSDIGIYKLSQKGGFDWVNKVTKNNILEKVFAKINRSLKDVVEVDKKDGWRVRISGIKPNPGKDITGGAHLLCLIDKDFYITHPIFCWVYKDNLTPYEQNVPAEKSTWKKGAYTVPKGVNWVQNMFPGAGGKWKHKYNSESAPPLSIKFDTEQEAFNFEKSLSTNFMRYVNYQTKFGGTQLILNKIPFMENYKESWTDEKFYKYFEIEKEEQQKIWDFLNEKSVPDIGKRPE